MQFGDLNNDGTLDIYLTTLVSADRIELLVRLFKNAGGNSTIISEAAIGHRWKVAVFPVINRSVPGSTMAPAFVDVAQAFGATDTHDGRSVVLAD